MKKTWQLSLTEAVTALDTGAVTATELVNGSLERIEELDDALNVFVHLAPERALRLAGESDWRRESGTELGPLDGVPFSVKDNLFAADMPATWGSVPWKDFVPPQSDLSVERLEKGGAINLGKTNTPEMAASSNTDNLLFGVTRNPYDTSLTPGGSSGGATASVATGMTTFALGTDAGGSTRSPASITGLYGLRPTNGRVARAFGFPPLMIDFQVIGLITRNLADMRLLFDNLAGPDDRDPASRLVPDLTVEGRPAKVGWFVEYPGFLIEPEIAERVETAAKALQQAGVEVLEVPPPFDLGAIRSIQEVLRSAGVRAGIAAAPDPSAPLSAPIQAVIDTTFGASATDYAVTMRALTAFRREVSINMSAYDALLLPTTETWASAAEETKPSVRHRPARRRHGSQRVDATGASPYTSWVNAVGYPGLNVPVAPLANDLPIGVQLVARAGGDRILFDLAEHVGTPMPTLSGINVNHRPSGR
jgi:aspartyl-tRNA(Asn)/glutamyl-tRNA(Gln) amidotransferase subunit A